LADDIFERSGLLYVRFTDDFLIMARLRSSIRRAMGWLTHELNNLKLEKHPDKAFIGRIERGFDFRDIILHRSGCASRR
tara:strand:- start:8250 stop:8486 length:237 start_codon:yes stop_codon:yes gene_type:complete